MPLQGPKVSRIIKLVSEDRQNHAPVAVGWGW
jgi:hypothetical protein